MTQFVKTKVSVCGILGDKIEIIKEMGYLYKNNLSLIKRDTNSWVLSHEHSGYLVIRLNMPFDLAKQVTMIIHSLIDWAETDKETINLLIREKEETMKILGELSTISSEKEIEEIRNKLLQNVEDTTSTSDLIDLMVA